MGKRYEPFRQFPDVCLRIVGVGLAVGGHDLVPNYVRVLIVHIIREVVEMKEPVHEVTAYPQLMEGG